MVNDTTLRRSGREFTPDGIAMCFVNLFQPAVSAAQVERLADYLPYLESALTGAALTGNPPMQSPEATQLLGALNSIRYDTTSDVAINQIYEYFTKVTEPLVGGASGMKESIRDQVRQAVNPTNLCAPLKNAVGCGDPNGALTAIESYFTSLHSAINAPVVDDTPTTEIPIIDKDNAATVGGSAFTQDAPRPDPGSDITYPPISGSRGPKPALTDPLGQAL